MKYTGFINSEDNELEVYLNKNGDLCLCIRYSQEDEEYTIKIEKEDIGFLIGAIKEMKDHIDTLQKSDKK